MTCLGWVVEVCGGKSVKDWTLLLLMVHILQGNLHTRQDQVAFLCGIYQMIMLKEKFLVNWV